MDHQDEIFVLRRGRVKRNNVRYHRSMKSNYYTTGLYSALASAYRLAGNTTAATATEKQRDSALAKPGPPPARN